MNNMGFFESLLNDMALWAAVQDSKDAHGRPDPYKAAGIAYGMRGDLSTGDLMKLGRDLGAEGAFDSRNNGFSGSGKR